MDRKMYRNVWETRSSSSQKRSERGQEVLAARPAGYPWPEQMDRKMYRNVWEARSSRSQKRSEPAAHPCRGPGGQAGDWHGGSPWFKGGVEPGRAPAGVGRDLLRPRGDERDRSLSHRGAVSFKSTLSSFLATTATGRSSFAPRPEPRAEDWVCFPARSRLYSS